MLDIDYRELADDSFEARTEDGFQIVISREFDDGFRRVAVWPLGFAGATCTDRRGAVSSCKESAEAYLASFRAFKRQCIEQGRAYVRAAQGQMAEAMKPISMTKAVALLYPDEVVDVGEASMNPLLLQSLAKAIVADRHNSGDEV